MGQKGDESMWSLPNIVKMNEEAHRRALSDRPLGWYIEHGIDPDTLEPAECEHIGDACEEPLHGYVYYDIFSDDPKGVLFLCERHDGYYGFPDEGYFECDDCERVFIENYTWEPYWAYDGEGVLCLNCYAQRVINDPGSWISLDDDGIEGFTADRLKKAKHIFAVGGPRHGLEPVGGPVCFETLGDDAATLSGLRSVKALLRQAQRQGHTRALVVIDGIYQFTLTVGVYVGKEQR